jgi:magnesium chelatase subunit D
LADLSAPFIRATTALALLAIDPGGLGGIMVRARSGPVRDAFSAMFAALPLPLTRLHPGVSDEALFGGLDLSATLSAGRIVQERGLLEPVSTLILTMAERTPPQLAARLALTLDQGRGHCLIALDEGAEPDEAAPPALTERLAFFVDMVDVACGDITGFPPEPEELAQARAALSSVRIDPETLTQITQICLQLGIDGLRAPLFAVRAARAHAALLGHVSVEIDDIEAACALTLAHRATQFPQPQDTAPPEPQPPETEPDNQSPSETDRLQLPQELLLDAIRALLPDDLLARIAATQARRGMGSGSGAAKKGNRRGRPLPPRAGRLGTGARIDIVATLRAAAPWQVIRAKTDTKQGLSIRPADIRLKRFEDKSDRLLIFTVDASGSAALARLAEAKGAVELLLAQAYARRDHVALIAFRGTTAEILLPPTRSLVQTKRRLAALPGGGATPLAAGLQAAMELADQARRRGLTPTIALLTDGRANIALDGSANRGLAAEDSLKLARALRVTGIDGIVIDTGNRPEPGLKALSQTLGGTYLALPRVDAKRLSVAMAAVLDN